MKIFYIKWYDCIHNLQFVIINASNKTTAEKKFDKWCEEHPDAAPCAYSPRTAEVKNCLWLNSIS